MSSEKKSAVVPQELQDANQYNTTGSIVVGYSTSSIAGGPAFSYRDAERDLKFSGDQIRRTPTPVGELVTVTLETIVDAFDRTFTLVIPRIKAASGEEVSFQTFGFETTDASAAFTPSPGAKGVLQTYTLHELSGTAQAVQF